MRPSQRRRMLRRYRVSPSVDLTRGVSTMPTVVKNAPANVSPLAAVPMYMEASPAVRALLDADLIGSAGDVPMEEWAPEYIDAMSGFCTAVELLAESGVV